MKQILLFFCLCVCLSIKAQQVDHILDAIAGYDYETALTLIDAEEPNAQMLFLKAQSLKRLNRFSESIIALRGVLSIDPENQRAMIEEAECYRSMGRLAEALMQYEQVLTLDPEIKYVQLQRISLLCSMGKYEKALDAGIEILKTDRSVAVLRLIAQASEGMNNPFMAIACYNEILTNDSTDGNAASKIAGLFIRLNEPEEAVKITEVFRANDSTNIFVNRQNAQAYCLMENYEKAIERYEYLMSSGDTTHLGCYYLGISYNARNKPYEAYEYLKRAHENEPENVNILHHLARVCARTSWKPDGVRYMEQIFNLITPTDSLLTQLHRTMVECASLAMMPHPLINAYKELYKLDNTRHLYLYNIAEAYQKFLHDTPNAQRYLEMFVKTRPHKIAASQGKSTDEKASNYEKYYKAAAKKLEEIKQEKFFKEGKSDPPEEIKNK